MVDWALWYARQGYRVFPLHSPEIGPDGQLRCDCRNPKCTGNSRAKHPRTLNGFKDATIDEAQIRKLWSMWPNANIGIATGNGLLVVDVDPRHGGDAALAALEAQYSKLPETPIVLTGGGGVHYYLDVDEPKLKFPVNLTTGVELKFDGGYVVAPPSIHISGNRYAWEAVATLGEVERAKAPGWILDASRCTGPEVKSGRFELPDEIPDGQRNDFLFRFGRALKAYGWGEAEILAALLIVNEKRCKPPGSRTSILKLAHHVATLTDSPNFTKKATRADPSEPPADDPNDPGVQEQDAPPQPRAKLKIALVKPTPVEPLDDTAENDSRPPMFSDDAVALRFTAAHGHEARYCADWGKWLFWDGCRWKPDVILAAFEHARLICRAVSTECANRQLARIIAGAKTVAAVVTLARSAPQHATKVEQWDAHLWLLNTPSGVVDLRTGQSAAHDQKLYMSKITAVGPSGDCPLWKKFLAKVTGENEELQKYLARVCGYALTGSIREHVFFFFYGAGANGKGVFLNTVSAILGDHATVAPISTFIASRTEQHPTDLASLRGARLVTAQETERDRHWAEAKIKALTGGDKISARFMRQDFFEFAPIFKLLIAGNNKPQLRDVDEAIRRRFNLIPFEVVIPVAERDRDLTDKLRREWPGILQWMIDGCLEWQRIGLAPPAVVREATENYFDAEDALAQWIAECCRTGLHEFTFDLSTALYTSWKVWAKNAGEDPGTQKAFVGALEKRGFKASKGTRGIRIIRGLTLQEISWREPGENGE
jgi:putative DNA primase/helicase